MTPPDDAGAPSSAPAAPIIEERAAPPSLAEALTLYASPQQGWFIAVGEGHTLRRALTLRVSPFYVSEPRALLELTTKRREYAEAGA